MTVLVVALIVALVVAFAALGGTIGYAATCRRRAVSAEASAVRWREATQARARSGLGDTTTFSAIAVDDDEDDEIGWTAAEELLVEK